MSSSICEAAACMYIQQLHFILLLLNEFLHCFYIYAVFSKVLREAVLDMIAVLFSSHFQYFKFYIRIIALFIMHSYLSVTSKFTVVFWISNLYNSVIHIVNLSKKIVLLDLISFVAVYIFIL